MSDEQQDEFEPSVLIHKNRRFYVRCYACVWESQHYLWRQSADEASILHHQREHKGK